ncbi:MAG: hypothetical protein ACOX61_11295 [Brooklawnia sp.]
MLTSWRPSARSRSIQAEPSMTGTATWSMVQAAITRFAPGTPLISMS